MPPSNARKPFPDLLFIVGTVALLAVITTVDGRALAEHTRWGQPAAAVATGAYWIALWIHASPRLRRLMAVGVVAATAGEALFCLAFGMYGYRLGNIPLYVPPGHTILYATVFLFVRQPWVMAHRRALTAGLYLVAAGYSVAWLQAKNDVYGFACLGAFLAVTAVLRESRLFFVSMYLLVAYLELCGTHFGCWAWKPILLGRFRAFPSGNPPSGVAVFYMGFDVGCLLLYLFTRLESYERYVSRWIGRRRARLATGA